MYTLRLAKIGSHETVSFALAELEKYLKLIDKRLPVDQRKTEKYDSEKQAMQDAQEAILNLELNDYSVKYFKKLAEEKSADALTVSNGGLYEGLTKGNLVDAKELEEWIFDPSRKKGDITLLQTEKYGYHVVYIEEIGEPVWYLRAREGMVSARFSEYVSDLGDDHVVYINDNIVYTVLETEIKE